MLRRFIRGGALVATLALTATCLSTAALSAAAVLPASPDSTGPAEASTPSVELSLMATTDVHGHVFNWDYFANSEYTRPADILGLSRSATAIDEVRAAKGNDSVIVVDNGDSIQGTPLTYYYGMGPGRAGVIAGDTVHPMAKAYNTIGYDALVVGNHEYNYGLELLGAYESQLDAPLLGANVIDESTGESYHEPYTLINRTIDGNDITVGVIGLVTPGIRLWDKQNVEGKLEFEDMVAAAKKWVPIVKEQADVVIVLAHTGEGTQPNADYDETALYENTVNNIASLVPDIDVIVAGHTHRDRPSTIYTNEVSGKKVLVTQPNYWARSVNEVTLNLIPTSASTPSSASAGTEWAVDWGQKAPVVTPHYGKDITAENPALVAALSEQHDTAVNYVNTPIATSTQPLSAATSYYEDTPILDFINFVQTDTVHTALQGSGYASLPIVSQASPFSRTAVFPQGELTIRDLSALYVFDNTLKAVTLTGAQLKDYLEFSARYFKQVEVGAPFDPATGTNAVSSNAPNGIPDYNYDVLSGVNYQINISAPVGQRIVGLTRADGTPLAAEDKVIFVSNNYRQNGGGDYPHVSTAPVVYDEQAEIRQLLINWSQKKGVVDPADFFVKNWSLRSTVPSEEEDVVDPIAPTAAPVPSDGSGSTTAATPAAAALATTGASDSHGALLLAIALLGGAAALLIRRKEQA